MVFNYRTERSLKEVNSGCMVDSYGSPAEGAGTRSTPTHAAETGYHRKPNHKPSAQPACNPSPVLALAKPDTWVKISKSPAGSIDVECSHSLQSRLETTGFKTILHTFAQLFSEDPEPYAGHAYSKSSDDHCDVQPGSKVANAEMHIHRQKRRLSSHTKHCKRRKTGNRKEQESCPAASRDRLSVQEGASDTDSDEQEEEDEAVNAPVILEEIMIKNEDEVWKTIAAKLWQMKQANCKKVAKAWIKLKEPRKMVKYPYNGGATKEEAKRKYGEKNPGELTKPSWWCQTKGWQRGEGCRHREPDHVKRAERMLFMKHMLRICPVAQLQESTREWCSSPETPCWAIPILGEVYSLRRGQERYANDEIDGSTVYHIEVPRLRPSVSSKGSTKISEHKIVESRQLRSRTPSVVRNESKAGNENIEQTSPSFKVESSEPQLMEIGYAEDMPSVEAPNKTEFLDVDDTAFQLPDMQEALAQYSKSTTSSCLGLSTSTEHNPFLNVGTEQLLGYHSTMSACATAPTKRSTIGARTGSVFKGMVGGSYPLSYPQSEDCATGNVQQSGTGWPGIEDASLSTSSITQCHLAAHGLPSAISAADDGRNCISGGSLISNRRGSSYDETFVIPSELPIMYGQESPWCYTASADDPAPCTIDPRSGFLSKS